MSIFTDPADALKELQDIRLQMVAASPGLSAAARAKRAADGTSYYQRKLQAAEAEVQRRLQVFLEPTELFPVNPPTDDELAALNGTPWSLEPAYDMPENFIQVQFAGFLQLNQRPAASVSDVKVIHPATNEVLYDIPLGWVRLDFKHGQMTIVPTGFANSAPVSIFGLQMFTMGVVMPHMIWVRYRAGLDRNSPYVPDIQDQLLRLAALRCLEDQFIPQSGSISADGLSRSVSQDLGKHRNAIEAQLQDLRDSINGVTFGIV